MTRLITIMIGSAAMLLVAVWFGFHDSPRAARKQPGDSHAEEPSTVEENGTGVRNRWHRQARRRDLLKTISDSRRQSTEVEAKPKAARSDPQKDDADPARSARRLDAEEGQRAMRRLVRRMQSLKQRLSREQPDTNWNRDVDDFFSRRLELGKLPGTQIKKIDCRETACRIEMYHQDEDALNAFARTTKRPDTRTPWNNMEGFGTVDTEGSRLVSVSYVPRQGHVLPREGEWPPS